MKGSFFCLIIALALSTTLGAAELLRLRGTILPNVSLDQIDQSTFSIQTNSDDQFHYEVSHKKDYQVIKQERLIRVKKKQDGHQQKVIFLSIVAQ